MRATSDSLHVSRTPMNASLASEMTAGNPQPWAMRQVLQSTKGSFPSVWRTTWPMVISVAGRASCKPPWRPLVVLMKPALPRS